jgi:hypothetical protein
LEDDIVDVHMEMLEKHRLVEEEEVTRIGTSKFYTISLQNMEKEFLLYIELFPSGCLLLCNKIPV